ncbi:hypothetical protein P7M32_10845, partial [Bisgaard Taxon 10/6]|nr:hypothetical protein [Exercitatus varius]
VGLTIYAVIRKLSMKTINGKSWITWWNKKLLKNRPHFELFILNKLTCGEFYRRVTSGRISGKICKKYRYYVAVAQNLKYNINRSKIFDALNFKTGLRAFLLVNFS